MRARIVWWMAGATGLLGATFLTAPERVASAPARSKSAAMRDAASQKSVRRAVPGGQLLVQSEAGEGANAKSRSEARAPLACPLKNTDVRADISGYTGRVRVRQTFHNSSRRKIEAIYVFPLPHHAAVDAMTMTVGGRRIIGQIKPREEARRVYEGAKARGHVASLLDQERPNIFTQSIANIEPGAQITVDISYVETLAYKDGIFEWVFPMTVGPRYIPGAPNGSRKGSGWSNDTTQVSDASRITPWVAPASTRAGHDISLTVNLNTGARLFNVSSGSHPINVQKNGAGRAAVTLRGGKTIPNKDFILRYRSASDAVEDALFTHADKRGRFFTLVLQPPQRVARAKAVPRELVFVLDTSGSMQGAPIEKAKSVIAKSLDGMGARDTFNLITFSGDTSVLWNEPRPATARNRAAAQKFLASRQGGGGTEMMKAIGAALEGQKEGRVRVVSFMTDGYVGNDMAIIDAVKKNAGKARVFSFGIGQGANRYLLDGIAREGRGEAEYVTLDKRGDETAARFYQRIKAPVLVDVALDWKGLRATEVYPRRLPDLWSHRPVMIHGRLDGNEEAGTVTLRGRTSTGEYSRRIQVRLDSAARRDVVASLWARSKVDDLMERDLTGAQNGNINAGLKQEITDLGVSYNLMTQFTSFVAVETRRVTRGESAETVDVPVEMPEGVSHAPHQHAIIGSAGSGGSAANSRGARMAARAGDPLLSVEAPKDAKQVVAILPGGEVKRLILDAATRKWEARFDIPTHAKEGDYAITIVVVQKDGARNSLVLRYRVDATAPSGAGRAAIVSEGKGALLHLELETGMDTVRVAALLPWGEKIFLKSAPQPEDGSRRFVALAALPKSWRAESAKVVKCVLTDRAHNRTVVTLDLSK